MEPRTICIVGGKGRMGRLFGRLFSESGYAVEVLDIDEAPTSSGSVGLHDVVLIAVPISAVDQVLEQLGPLTNPRGVVIDIASVKEGPISSMLRYCRGEVIGSHPLFGPTVESLTNRIVFVCPARGEKWLGWYQSFLESHGAKIVEIEAQRHDKVMAVAQVLRHLLLFCLGESLVQLEFDLDSDLPISGPWTSGLVEMLRHHLGQAPELYAEIALSNPYSPQVAGKFLDAAVGLCRSYGSGDREALIRSIAEISRYFDPSLQRESAPIAIKLS